MIMEATYRVSLFEWWSIYRTHISFTAQAYNIDNPILGDVSTPDLYVRGNCLSPSCTWFGQKKKHMHTLLDLYSQGCRIKGFTLGLSPYVLNTITCACKHYSRQLHCPPADYRWDRAGFHWQTSGSIQDRGAALLAVPSGWCTAGRNMSVLSH